MDTQSTIDAHTIVRSLSHALAWKGLDGRYLGCNPSFLSLLGVNSEADLIGTREPYGADVATAETVPIQDQKALRGETAIQNRLVHGQWYTENRTPIRDAQDQIIGVLISLTPAPQVESVGLEQAEIGFQALIDALPALIFWTDTHHVCRGNNLAHAQAFGFHTTQELLGFDMRHLFRHMPDQNLLRRIEQEHEDIMHSKCGQVLEYTASFPGQKQSTWYSYKQPLLNRTQEVIGLIGVSMNMTLHKTIFQNIIDALPVLLFWTDAHHVFLGNNLPHAQAFGCSSVHELVGQSGAQVLRRQNNFDAEMIERILQEHDAILQSGVGKRLEYTVVLADGAEKTWLSLKQPLLDQNKRIIGLIGISMDITEEKRAERLEIENQKYQGIVEEQQKFRAITDQVVHDIRSPLASLLMITKYCQDIPEMQRVALREAATRIGDIANHLLNQYQIKSNADRDYEATQQEQEPLLVSATVLHMITDKKYEFATHAVGFDSHISTEAYFAFVDVPSGSFKRMLSNAINNAVDAIEQNGSTISVLVDADLEWVRVTVQDRGKGMPASVLQKIQNNIAVTQGKEGGHGIGFTQIRDTLFHHHGHLSLQSELGSGTCITVQFPRVSPPEWIATHIHLNDSDTVVVLDDESSIHGAWRAHFAPVLRAHSGIHLHNFTLATEALAFLKSIPKEQVFLLTDYELLHQKHNGLQVIKESGVSRSLLVTSHYAKSALHRQAIAMGTHILPKQMASEIPIEVRTTPTDCSARSTQTVDLILVDDDVSFTTHLVQFLSMTGLQEIAIYHTPQACLQDIARYAQHTPILIDYHFFATCISGLELAHQLHELGYQPLYLLSGSDFQAQDLPHYLKAIRKNDVDALEQLTQHKK